MSFVMPFGCWSPLHRLKCLSRVHCCFVLFVLLCTTFTTFFFSFTKCVTLLSVDSTSYRITAIDQSRVPERFCRGKCAYQNQWFWPVLNRSRYLAWEWHMNIFKKVWTQNHLAPMKLWRSEIFGFSDTFCALLNNAINICRQLWDLQFKSCMPPYFLSR